MTGHMHGTETFFANKQGVKEGRAFSVDSNWGTVNFSRFKNGKTVGIIIALHRDGHKEIYKYD